ncbi:hypothetical protein THIOKS12210051 [Thiocapsa sp. KS1]|nr:hypothetical protein THIOKS12210051 [Thiocapsa sp. KS1]
MVASAASVGACRASARASRRISVGPPHVQNIRYLLQFCQDLRQVRHVLDLQGEAHRRRIRGPLRMGVDAEHVHVVVGENGGDIPQQTLAVRGDHQHVHRVACIGGLIRPAHVDEALCLGGRQVLEVAAILAMDGDAASAGDEPDDGIVGHRLAAGGEMGHEVVDPFHHNVRRADRARLVRLARLGLDLLELLGLALPHLTRDLPDREVAAPDRGQEILAALEVEAGRELFEIRLLRDTQSAQLALQGDATALQMLIVVQLLEPLANAVAGARRGQIAMMRAEPIAAGGGVLLSQDLDGLAAVQLVVQRHDPPVDACAAAAIADLRVDGVGEVECRGPLGQLDDLGLRGQHIDVDRLELGLEAFEEAAGLVAFVLELKPVAHPDDTPLELGVVALGLLVGPMGGDTELGMLMHLVGADLHLERLVLRTDDGRVERPIHVALGRGDVVVELLGDVLPESVHQSERGVAVRDRSDQDTYRTQVEDLGDLDLLALHLAPDAVDVFRAAGDLRVDAGLGERVVQGLDDGGDIVLALLAALGQELGDALVLLGVEVAQAQVFELPLDLPDTQPVGERGIDTLGVACDLGPAFRIQVLDGPHQVHALGEHDQHHPNVFGDAEQQAAQILLVLVLVLRRDDGVHVGDLADTGQVSDHAGNPGTESLFELRLGQVAVAQAAVEQGRDQGLGVHPQTRQDVRGGEHMADMGLAGLDAPVAATTRERRTGAGDLLELLDRVMARQPVEPVTDRVVVAAMRLGQVVGGFDHGGEATLGGGGRSGCLTVKSLDLNRAGAAAQRKRKDQTEW